MYLPVSISSKAIWCSSAQGKTISTVNASSVFDLLDGVEILETLALMFKIFFKINSIQSEKGLYLVQKLTNQQCFGSRSMKRLSRIFPFIDLGGCVGQ